MTADRRGDDALRALRASLSVPEPSYHGEFYSFSGMVVDPCAVQDRVPIWIGGRTLRSCAEPRPWPTAGRRSTWA